MNDLFTAATSFEAPDALSSALLGVLAYVFILWAALVVWVARDVVGRTKNIAFHVAALSLVIFLNVFGLVIYLIVRPQRTLLEKYYESLEERALSVDDDLCASCNHALSPDHRYCPACGGEARTVCHHCKKLVGKTWSVCAYCGTQQKQGKKTEKAQKDSPAPTQSA